MDIHKRLVGLVEDADSFAHALRSVTREIADALHAESCGVFLRGRTGRLDLRSHFGEGVNRRARNAAESVAGEALTHVQPASAEAGACTLLAAPMVSRGRPIGAIVVQRGEHSTYSAEEIHMLSAVASQIVGFIESGLAVENIAGVDTTDESFGTEKTSTGERILHGTAVSPGIAVGVVAFREMFPRDLVRREGAFGGIHAERQRLRDAFQKTRNDLLRLQSTAASEIGEEQALIFGSHLLFLSDPMLQERIEHGFAARHSAALAVDDAFEDIVRRLRNVVNPYFQDRIEDIEDVRSRVLGHLLGSEDTETLGTRVVVSPRTTPSVIIELKAQGAVGVASELGGTTSHGVLLARALGVPAVTGVTGLVRQVSTGDVLIIDGDQGHVIVRPTAETFVEYTRRSEAAERARTEFLKYRDRATKTADGVRVKLQANIALGVDLEVARDNGADGIGLYRTEFPFIAREGFPTVDEQVRIYVKAYEAFPHGPITFRILDLAGDKFVPTKQLGIQRNAFHGYRSIRVLFDYPHVLRDQVQAFAIAAGNRPLRLLIPMITSIEELRKLKQLVTSALGQLPPAVRTPRLSVGAMIEAPAAVEIVSDLATEVAFFSIGTNDLIQYTIVADREDPRLSLPQDAFHPAILRMVRRVVTAAHNAGKEVGVCGEMAGIPELAVALLAIGVDALSVTPHAIPHLKRSLARVRIKPLIASIDHLLAISTTAAIAQALKRYMIEEAEDNLSGGSS